MMPPEHDVPDCTCPWCRGDGAATVPAVGGDVLSAAEREALVAAMARVRTHNGTSVTSENLRWAATHEALCRSYIFDVLMALADALAAAPAAVSPDRHDTGEGQ